MQLYRLVATVGVNSAILTGSSTVAAAHPRDGLDGLRDATARYHSIAAAEQRGYGLLTDAQHIACIDLPGTGGMGVHWANTALTRA
jgi:hypothetical protein